MSVQYVATRPAEGKQSVVGIVAVLVAMVALVGMVAAAGFGAEFDATAIKVAGHTSNPGQYPGASPWVTRAGLCYLAMLALWVVSVAAFVLGILGARTHPRNMGITAIAVSVLTPVIGLIVLLAFALPVYMRYPA